MRVLLSHSPPSPLLSIQDTTAFVWQPAFGVHSALQNGTPVHFCSVSIHQFPIYKYHPPPPVMLLNATTSIQSEKLRERLKPRSSQATSVIDTDCSYPIVPQHTTSALSTWPLLPVSLSPSHPLPWSFSLHVLCHASKSPLLNICLTWQDASVAWQLLFTFVHKRGSGTLSPQEHSGNQHLSQKNVTICFVPCTLLCHQRAAEGRCSSWEVSSQVFQVACHGCLTSGLWFCTWRVATLWVPISTVLFLQKITTCLLVCSALGHCHKRRSHPDSLPGTLQTREPLVSPPLQHALYELVLHTLKCFSLHVSKWKELWRGLIHPVQGISRLSLVSSRFFHLANNYIRSHSQLPVEVQSTDCIVTLAVWLRWLPASTGNCLESRSLAVVAQAEVAL